MTQEQLLNTTMDGTFCPFSDYDYWTIPVQFLSSTLKLKAQCPSSCLARLYIDNGEPFRFRVDSVEWQESEPVHPSIRDRPKPEEGGEEVEKDPYQVAGYKILVRSCSKGFPCPSSYSPSSL